MRAGRVNTIARLAALDREIPGLDESRRDRFVRQAKLQVAAREQHPDAPPPFELVTTPTAALNSASETEAVGFAAMPAPDDGDVFLDFEGHPFWRADVGLFFLFGWIERNDGGEWEFKALWAHDQAEEAAATKQLVDYLDARRQRFPNMHVYHYNHTERSSLVRLTMEYGVAELELERLIETGMFVDLYPIITASLQAGTESYGLKQMERLASYERGHVIERGAGAVVEYEKWMADREADHLTAIAAYNEDDVRATRAVRDWLVEQRPATTPWRPAVLDKYVVDPELDARIEALHAFGPGTDEHLMGDLLGYWRRENSAVAMKALLLSTAPDTEQMESMGAIARLKYVGRKPQHHAKTGKELKWEAAVFTFPPQPHRRRHQAGRDIDPRDERSGVGVLQGGVDRPSQGRTASRLGQEAHRQRGHPVVARSLRAVRREGEASGAPAARRRDARRRRQAVSATRCCVANCRSSSAGGGPAGGQFTRAVEDICGWVTQLDGSFVPIQGPPGSGKTFTGAHIIRTLVKAGKRVGVTAMSHHAIDNLMEAVVERFVEDGDVGELRAVRKSKPGDLDHVEYIDDNGEAAGGDFNVLAGTPWFFASTAMRDNPVDVLVVDEAGQLGLADTLAATISAANVILLGDPQQLPQVSQASHPNGAGASALEHILGDDRTVSADRGVLLDVTWRMHPRRVQVHLRHVLRGQADEPRVVRRPVDRGRCRPALDPCRPRRPLDRVARGGRTRRQDDRRSDGQGLDRPEGRHPPADRRRLHRRHPVQRPAPPDRSRARRRPVDGRRSRSARSTSSRAARPRSWCSRWRRRRRTSCRARRTSCSRRTG